MAPISLKMQDFLSELEDCVITNKPHPKEAKKQVNLMKDLFKNYAKKKRKQRISRTPPPLFEADLMYPVSDTEDWLPSPHAMEDLQSLKTPPPYGNQLLSPPLYTTVESSVKPCTSVKDTILSDSLTKSPTNNTAELQQIKELIKELREQVETLSSMVSNQTQLSKQILEQYPKPSSSTPKSAVKLDLNSNHSEAEDNLELKRLLEEKEKEVKEDMRKKNEATVNKSKLDKEHLEEELCPCKQWPTEDLPKDSSESLKSYHIQKGLTFKHKRNSAHNSDDVPITAYPLRMTANNQAIYQPFALKDIEGLMLKLPKLTRGAPAFLRALTAYTAGETLCWGDVLAVLTRATDDTVTAKVCVELSQRLNYQVKMATPYAALKTQLLSILKDMYPTCIPEDLLALRMQAGEDYYTYKQRAKTQFHDATGEAIRKGTGNTILFFTAIVKGMPQPVQQHLSNVVGLYTKDEEDFDAHCLHYLSKFLDKKQKEQEDLQKVAVSTQKLQLKQLKDEVENKKNKHKATPVMSVTAEEGLTDSDPIQQIVTALKLAIAQSIPAATQMPAPQPAALLPTPAFTQRPSAAQPAPVIIYNNRDQGRSNAHRGRNNHGKNYNGRNNHGRNNTGRGPQIWRQSNPQSFNDQCRLCHGPGHWAKDCHQKQRGWQQPRIIPCLNKVPFPFPYQGPPRPYQAPPMKYQAPSYGPNPRSSRPVTISA